MFEEFRSNLLLLLHSRYPEGMVLSNLESEYNKYFNQVMKPGMLSIGAVSWLEVLTETSLKHDITLFECESLIYIKCIVSRTEWEMMIIAKLAKYTHFKYAKSSFFQVQDCSCCTTSNLNQAVVSSHSFQPKDVEMDDDRHLDRGCFMGIITQSDDDLTKSDFIDPTFLSVCENFSNDSANIVLNADDLDIKREITSPIDPETNFVNDYLLTAQHLVLQPDFMDMESIKLENESFAPFDDTEKINYSSSQKAANNLVENTTNTEKVIDPATKKTTRGVDPNYVPESEEESEDIEDESNDESNPPLTITTQANKLITNSIRRKRFLSSGKPGKFSCKWRSCLKNFNSQMEFRDHIIAHGVMKNNDKPPLSAQKAKSLCQRSALSTNEKTNTKDQSSNVTQNQSTLPVVQQTKEKSSNNSSVLSPNKSSVLLEKNSSIKSASDSSITSANTSSITSDNSSFITNENTSSVTSTHSSSMQESSTSNNDSSIRLTLNCDSSVAYPQVVKQTKAKEVQAKGKSKESVGAGAGSKDELFHCKTLGCNRSFSVYTKLGTHQRRCGAISDFSCRWPECARMFQSSLDLHNHVKMDHRKCQGPESKANLQMIEKTIVLTCKIQSCGYSFRCRKKLEEHEKQCVLTRKKLKPSIFSEDNEKSLTNAENVGSTLKAKSANPSLSNSPTLAPNPPNRGGSNSKATSSNTQNQEPKGFARMTKYDTK